MFRIGDFSRLTQVTVKALRHYDSLGLLKPVHIDPDTGYRYYSASQVPRLNRILAFKDLGLSLEQIGQFLDADLSPSQLRAILLVKQEEVRNAIEQEESRLARIEARLRQIDEDAEPGYDVVLKRVEAQQVASVRRRIPQRRAVGALFHDLSLYQQRHGLSATSWTAIWHDPEYCETDIDAEATFSSLDPLPPDAGILVYTLPAATMACVAYTGATDSIGRVCRSLLNWVQANGYRVAGPEGVRALEPDGRASPDRLLEMQLPVEKDETTFRVNNPTPAEQGGPT